MKFETTLSSPIFNFCFPSLLN